MWRHWTEVCLRWCSCGAGSLRRRAGDPCMCLFLVAAGACLTWVRFMIFFLVAAGAGWGLHSPLAGAAVVAAGACCPPLFCCIVGLPSHYQPLPYPTSGRRHPAALCSLLRPRPRRRAPPSDPGGRSAGARCRGEGRVPAGDKLGTGGRKLPFLTPQPASPGRTHSARLHKRE